MDMRIVFLIIAAVVVSGFFADAFFGREMHNWDDPSSQAATDRVLLKLGEPAAHKRIDEAVSSFEETDPPEVPAGGDSE